MNKRFSAPTAKDEENQNPPNSMDTASVIKKAAHRKSKSRALARQLRKTGRFATLSADISSGIEGLAGLSDKVTGLVSRAKTSLLTFNGDISEDISLLSSMEDISAQAKEAVSETFYAYEETVQELHNIIKNNKYTPDNVQLLEKNNKEIITSSEELATIIKPLETLDADIRKTAEQLDIAVLNASLEAGRAGDNGRTFTVVAEGVRKVSTFFIKATDDLTDVTRKLTTLVKETVEETSNSYEKVRAVSFLSKGMNSSLEDMNAVMERLIELIESVSFTIDETASDSDNAAPVMENIVSGIKGCHEEYDKIHSSLFEHDTQLNVIAGLAENIAAAGEKLASGSDIDASLDALYTAGDDFSGALDDSAGHIDETTQVIEKAINVTDSLLQTINKDSEIINNLSESINSIQVMEHDVAAKTVNLEKKLSDILEVLKSALDGLNGLATVNSFVIEKGNMLIMLLGRLRRISFAFADFASRMDFLSTVGQIEVIRNENISDNLASFPKTFSAVSSDITRLSKEIGAIADTTEEKVFSIVTLMKKNNCEEIMSTVSELTDGISEIVDTKIKTAADGCALLAFITSEQKNRVDKTIVKFQELSDAKKAADLSYNEAIECEKSKIVPLETLRATADKLYVLADELYPDDL